MTRYAAGRRAEWRARDILRGEGHLLVIRAAGSKGPFDLVALHHKGWLRLIQVKRGRAISKAERADLVALKAKLPNFCMVEIWSFPARKRGVVDVEVL